VTRINIDYEFTGIDGSHHQVSLYDATPEQAAVVSWLRAEDEWKRRNQWQAKELVRERAEERKAAERAAKVTYLREQHEALLQRFPNQFFRRAVLERHGPIGNGSTYPRGGLLVCMICDDGKYEAEGLEFPCAEYRFARDWSSND
jgi:hypothetical protein